MIQYQVVEELLNGAVGTVMLGPAQKGKCGADREKPPVPEGPRGRFPLEKVPSLNDGPARGKRQTYEQEQAPKRHEQVYVAALDQGDFLRFGEGAEEGVHDTDGSAREGAEPFGPPENQTNQQPTRKESRREGDEFGHPLLLENALDTRPQRIPQGEKDDARNKENKD